MDEDENSGVYEMPTPDLHEVFFGRDGRPLDPSEFRALYPDGRVKIASAVLLGAEVSTEFVGINHNLEPGGEPWIFETIAHVDGHVVYSEWSSDEAGAHRAHRWALALACLGGALVWHARARALRLGRGRS